jgi:hypothetical protein
MKFMIGYQLTENQDFVSEIIQNKSHIYEVYFSWGKMPNGRNSVLINKSFTQMEAQERLVDDLKILSKNGIALNLLLNGNCYGRLSLAKSFFQEVGDTIDHIQNRFSLVSITTTSPILARFVKDNFAQLEVRASVNMGIGTIRGMDYVGDVFDGYYMQREYNRDISHITQLKKWCAANRKKLYLLANSGCLNNCSAHVFHDNLVSHETEISQMDNITHFTGICWDYLKNKHRWISLIRDTSYIRPEDIGLYEGLFDAVKLATRVNNNPIRVLKAYINGSYRGAVTELCEPDFSSTLYPFILDNISMDGFGEHVLRCEKNCENCSYCEHMLEKALIDLSNKY